MLMPDFATVPPEVNSGKMYSGPGADPMLAASAAWDALAAELFSAATGYGSVIAELTGNGWMGPASLSMAAAAAPQVMWLHRTAAQAEQTAAQAKAAVAAYELAFAMTVPPPVIAANRSLLATLVATNFFGQNSPAIAATEAHYAEMWAQDATAMYGYAGFASSASQLSQFTAPRPAADSAGLAAQSGTVAHAAGNAAGAQATPLSTLLSSTPVALQQLAAPAGPAASSGTSFLGPAITALDVAFAVPKLINVPLSTSSAVVSGRSVLIQDQRIDAQAEKDAEKDAEKSAKAAAGSQRLVATRPVVSAGMGRTTPVGALSVPPNWTTAAPEIRPAALALPEPGSGIAATATTETPPVPGNAFSQTALGTLSRHGYDDKPRPKSKPVIVRSPAAG
jgi:PPE-repeat protein